MKLREFIYFIIQSGKNVALLTELVFVSIILFELNVEMHVKCLLLKVSCIFRDCVF